MKRTYLSVLGYLFLLASCQTDIVPDTSVDTEDEPKEIVYNIPPNFELEILYSPLENNDGSWVALAEGENGMFYASDQNGDLYQFKIPPVGEVLDSTQVDTIDLDIGHAHGLLWAFNSLYVSVNERWEDGDGEPLTETGSGVYRLQDTDGDGQLDELKMLLKLEGSGEHGPHSMVLSPDGKQIYFIAGNYTKIPEAIVQNSCLPNNWEADNLFPPFLDARGHATQIEPPGGWIARTDPDGKNWELVASGFRNPFDMAFNRDGELFAFDADMEWDIGMPWYRPIRICHATSGSNFGWRTGSGKWPDYYPDNLPAVVNLGQGSPTAVLYTAGLDFPQQYKNGLLVFDWSFGTAYYVDLEEKGSTYTGGFSEFFSGTPLPLTDAVAGSDGALYFASGGRKLESHLYRLRYTGPKEALGMMEKSTDEDAAKLRQLRRQLEASHNRKAPESIPLLWEQLNHPDRFIRYAARVGLEHQDVGAWQSLFMEEKDPVRIIQASLALARFGKPGIQKVLFQKLAQLDPAGLSRAQQLDRLRAIGLVAIRRGMPETAIRQGFINEFNAQFPTNDPAMDREFSQLLVYFGDPLATAKCVELLEKHTREKTVTHPDLLSEEVSNRSEQYGPTILDMLKHMPPTEALFYGVLLSRAEQGWDDTLRDKYFSWFFDALNSKGGMSFKPFLENIRKQAMTHVPEDLQAHCEELSGVYKAGEELMNLPQPEGPGGDYNSTDIHGILGKGLDEYEGNIETGRRIYEAALCAMCHRMRGEGGSMGPDLTQVHTRFNRGEIIDAIFSPNDEISDQYAFTLFDLKDGERMTGKILSETGDKIVLMPNPFNMTYTVEIPKSNVLKSGLSPVSPMPSNLLNRLNAQEITDLFAYLLSGGDEEWFYYGGTKGLDDE
ncbi:MAG: c-type cytochrome [Lewinella sp.]|nr:c-type cytochrome [Lewinella sp.]